MLQITSIKNGVVIDHIQPGQGYRIFKFLNLHHSDFKAALIMNVDSQLMGKKDLIKIENHLHIDLDILGLFSDRITVNLIENEQLISKQEIVLPQHVEGVLACHNPRCISNHERYITTRFTLEDAKTRLYRCDYCDHYYEGKMIKS